MPIHSSGITAADVGLLEVLVRDLMTSFPGDVVIGGGDLNLDRWRVVEHRRQGLPISILTRLGQTCEVVFGFLIFDYSVYFYYYTQRITVWICDYS